MAILWCAFLLFCGAGASGADAGAMELSRIRGGSVTFSLGSPTEQLRGVAWTVNQTNVVVSVGTGTPPHVLVLDPSYKGRLNVSAGSYSLQITDLRMKDTGTYRAQITMDKDTITREFTLRVYRQVPEPTIVCDPVSCGNESCNYSLSCTVRDGGENVTYRWTLPEKGAFVINESVLLIPQRPQTAPRNFTCTAQNPVSNSSRTVPAKDFCPAPTTTTITGNSSAAQITNRTRTAAIVIALFVFAVICGVALWWKLKNRKRATQKFGPGAAGDTGADVENSTIYAQIGNLPPNYSRKETEKRDPETKDDKTIYSTVHLPNQSPPQTDDEKLCKEGQESMEMNEKTVYSSVNQPTNTQEMVGSKSTPRSKKITEYDQII